MKWRRLLISAWRREVWSISSNGRAGTTQATTLGSPWTISTARWAFELARARASCFQRHLVTFTFLHQDIIQEYEKKHGGKDDKKSEKRKAEPSKSGGAKKSDSRYYFYSLFVISILSSLLFVLFTFETSYSFQCVGQRVSPEVSRRKRSLEPQTTPGSCTSWSRWDCNFECGC